VYLLLSSLALTSTLKSKRLADNGSNWFISGAPDPRWNDDELNTLKSIKGSNFEVVKMENIVTP
jgi:hypothetical protein